MDTKKLQEIKDEASELRDRPGTARPWRRAYSDLAHACEVLIAFEARATIPIKQD